MSLRVETQAAHAAFWVRVRDAPRAHAHANTHRVGTCGYGLPDAAPIAQRTARIA